MQRSVMPCVFTKSIKIKAVRIDNKKLFEPVRLNGLKLDLLRSVNVK